MKFRLFLLVVCLLTFLGCASKPCPCYHAIQIADFYGPETPVRKPYGTVVPFESPEDLKQPYEVIAFMSCSGPKVKESKILRAMLYRAADIGADGLLLNTKGMAKESTDNESRRSKDINIDIQTGWGAMINNPRKREVPIYIFRAKAIRYKKLAKEISPATP